MTSPDIIVYGTVALDRFHPASIALAGGEALNTACLLAGWGVSVALVGTAIGVDPEGELLRERIDAMGLSRAYIPTLAAAVTPVCDIHVAPDGERQMSGRGFAQAIAPPVPYPLLTHRPIVTVDPNLGAPAIELARAAACAGCRVVAMDFAHVPEVVATASVLQLSPESLRRFGGPQGAPEEIVQALPTPVVVLTQGARGGLVQTKERLLRYPAYPLSPIVDTTGAGDAFRAGLCLGLREGWELEPTLAFASATAACHCQRLGGSSQIPREEIEQVMAKNSPNYF